MANQSTLKHDDHMILDQPLLKVPYELLRKNFRTAHFVSERESASLKTTLKETATASMGAASVPTDAIRSLDAMIARMHGVRRKMAACADEEARLTQQLGARVAHLADLQAMRSFDDGGYDGWSRRRLDVLLVDYLLRQGYNATAADLAREKGLDDLVDVKTFLQMSRIREALLAGSVTEALAWCLDNKKELRGLKDHKNLLEFSLRFQQYVELVRTQDDAKLLEAIAHAKKYLQPFRDAFPEKMRQACGLLVSPPTLRGSEYAFLYAPERWADLADLFTRTHGQLLALPPTPLLHIALGVGLSALKTPACHASGRPAAPVLASGSSTMMHAAGAAAAGSSGAIPTHNTALTQSVCPICSTELNELARGVPYAHHTQSHVEADLVMLPNRRVYGRARLEDYARKSGLPEGQVKDLRTGEIYPQHDLKKVFIT